MNNQFECWTNYLMHQILNKLLLVIVGALLACELKLSSTGMTSIYTAAQLSELRSPDEEMLNSSGEHINYLSRKHCPDGPPPQWESQLDAASKAYLAPIVFNGKLISISEDYGGRIGATFRVQKLIKNSSTLTPNLAIGAHVTLYFVRNKLSKSEPPFCAIYMNDNFVKLRPQEKYIIFASPPLTIFSNSVYMSVALDSNSNSNSNSNHQLLRPNSITNSHTVINLSTFASPELHTKRSSRQVRKVLCRRCAKTPIVKGLNGDLRVATKGNLRLRCKVSGNPLPWVEWFRNGKRLKSRGRVTIKTRRRMSRLEIRRVSQLKDSGYYECRAMNVVAREPSIARQRIIVIPSTNTGKEHKSHKSHTSYFISTTTTRGPLWPQVRPCPIPSFCLNGGVCTLYEAVGEYVCHCAKGFIGLRCEYKDVSIILEDNNSWTRNAKKR